MATELYIKPYGSDTYYRVDLQEGIPLPYTYSILDVRTPDKRDSHGSKTLVIPGTKNNNNLFEYIFEIGISGGYNPNKKAEVYVLQDSMPVIPHGILQLLSITRDKQDLDRVYYEVAIDSGIEDIFAALGESDLSVLDFSDMDHNYNATSQSDSWTSPIGQGYVYPMIDYSGRNRAVPASNFDAWNVDEFFPAVYVKEYWDRMFLFTGKTYTSTFLGSTLFYRLAIPFNKEKYNFSNAEIIAREFRAESTAPTTGAAVYPTHSDSRVELDNDSAGTAYDPSNIFDATVFEYTVPAGKAGFYSLEAFGELGFTTSATCTATTGGGVRAGLSILVYHSGGSLPFAQVGEANHPTINNGDPFTAGTIYYSQSIKLNIERIYLAEGDFVVFNNYTESHSNLVLSGGATMNAHVNNGAYLQNFLINELAEGSDIVMSSCIPEGIKMKDLLKSIIQAFHLYIEPDKDNPDNYIIEPRDDYYNSEVVDWSAKLDYEKGLEIIPMSDLQGREYIFKYKEDKDYYNDAYQKKYTWKDKPRTYGDYIKEIDNDFVTGQVVNELIFSATPSVGNDVNTRVIPTTLTLNGEKPEQKATNIRLLYWGGMKSYTGRAWVHYSKITNTYTSYINTYPYAGHLDDPFSPTLDLSFGMPKEVNWNIRRNNYTDGNLYNKYHKRFIEEITDADSRMVTGYFLLTPLDIFNLSFRKLYYFHKELYRLNKIIDYDLSEYKLVKCEFLKVKDPGVYTSSTVPVTGGVDDVWHDNKLPDVIYPKPHNNNTYGKGNAVVIGTDNIIAPNANGIMVLGVENMVGSNAQNILIQGSRNVIMPGVQNVSLINTNDTTISDNDVTYINGCLVDGCVAVVPEGGG